MQSESVEIHGLLGIAYRTIRLHAAGSDMKLVDMILRRMQVGYEKIAIFDQHLASSFVNAATFLVFSTRYWRTMAR